MHDCLMKTLAKRLPEAQPCTKATAISYQPTNQQTKMSVRTSAQYVPVQPQAGATWLLFAVVKGYSFRTSQVLLIFS